MKVVILCGGQGTRIRGVDDNVPKPMISIGQFPILWHIMKYYSQAGFTEFILCLGYKAEVIKQFFLNYEVNTNDVTLTLGDQTSIHCHDKHEESGWKVTLADTGLDTLTGSRVKRIQKYLGDDENFMLTYGDGLGDVDLNRLKEFHESHGKVMTVAGVRPPGRFGELECDASGMIGGFNEKPQATGGRISGGFFICRRELFDYIDEGPRETLEQKPMRRLVTEGQMMMYHHDGFWQCMDTFRDYSLLNSLWDEGHAPWKRW